MTIRRVTTSSLDKKYARELGPPQIPDNKPHDLGSFVVNKPWGYEYLMLRSPSTEVWSLFLRKDASTSMHCHPRKKTALILLEGKASFKTLRESYALNPLDSVVIDAGVFHQTKALSPAGIRVIEVETPPAKYDLLRLKDQYGREGTSYEGVDKMSLDEGECVRFLDFAHYPFQERNFHKVCTMVLRGIGNGYRDHDHRHLRNHDLVVIIGGAIYQSEKPQFMIADVASAKDFLEGIHTHRPEDLALLLISKPQGLPSPLI